MLLFRQNVKQFIKKIGFFLFQITKNNINKLAIHTNNNDMTSKGQKNKIKDKWATYIIIINKKVSQNNFLNKNYKSIAFPNYYFIIKNSLSFNLFINIFFLFR